MEPHQEMHEESQMPGYLIPSTYNGYSSNHANAIDWALTVPVFEHPSSSEVRYAGSSKGKGKRVLQVKQRSTHFLIANQTRHASFVKIGR